MKASAPVVLLLPLCFLFLSPIHGTTAAEKPAQIEQPEGEATVTLLEGMVSLLDKDGKPVRPLSPGDRCRPGDRFRTGNKAKLSLKLQDDTQVRFSDLTTFELVSLNATETPKHRDIKIQLLSGDAWVNAAIPYTGKGAVHIFVPQAVINITQSICRFTVFSDTSCLVKVYQGRIEIKHFQAPAPGPASDKAARPVEDKSTWDHLVKTMHQLHIRPDGSATNPFRFMVKTDETKWVLWNREQDAKIGTPAE